MCCDSGLSGTHRIVDYPYVVQLVERALEARFSAAASGKAGVIGGANSAGKSTVIHALHFAREVFERHNLDADQTIFGGKYIDLGGFDNFVHRHDREKSITIWIELAGDEQGLLIFDADYDLLSTNLDLLFGSLLNGAPTSIAVEFTIQWSRLESCPHVARTEIYIDGVVFAEITADANLSGAFVSNLKLDHPSLLQVSDLPRDEGDGVSLFDRESMLSVALSFCGECIVPGDGRRILVSSRGAP